MKAIAKHDCECTVYIDPNQISLNRVKVEKGHVFDLPVYLDKYMAGDIGKSLGKRYIIFQDGIEFISTFGKDFNYID